jgi:glycosyltransferase involved in cell wall biosynthesis
MMMGHREDVNEILAASDICVLTSDGAEGIPQAVLQYLAMAKPVVATDVGSVSEIITDGETGLLVLSRDVQAVADAVLKLLHDPDLAKRLGKNGREAVERRFSLNTMLDNVLTVYSNILKQKGKSTEW